jgi:hypothetical protein
MTSTPSDPPPDPRPPDLDPASVAALIEYAKAQNAHAQWYVDFSRSRGQQPRAQQLENVDGWAFVALALRESYDA